MPYSLHVLPYISTSEFIIHPHTSLLSYQFAQTFLSSVFSYFFITSYESGGFAILWKRTAFCHAIMETTTTRGEMGSSSISPLGRAPPELPYSLRQHKLSIAIAWTVLIINSCILPLALFYGLWFGTSLSRNLVFGSKYGSLWLRDSSRMGGEVVASPHEGPIPPTIRKSEGIGEPRPPHGNITSSVLAETPS